MGTRGGALVIDLVVAAWLALVQVASSCASYVSTEVAHARILALAERAAALGDVDPGIDVEEHARAAATVETAHASAELLLSIAWGESRFRADLDTGRVCGVMQVAPHDLGRDHDSACAAWREDLYDAYAAGVEEIEAMLADPRVHGSIIRALAYRACGNAAFVDGSACSRAKRAWPAWVLYRAKKLGGSP